jgi:hypothetical protein
LSPGSAPLVNRYASGNAWFVDRVTLVENADAELLAVKTINPATEAVVDRRFADLVGTIESAGAPGDTILLTTYEPNLLTYKAELATARVAVFSEIYYKYGWKAFIDDTPADHFRANYVLRGMTLPAGSHTITFRLNLISTGWVTGCHWQDLLCFWFSSCWQRFRCLK